MRNVSKWKPTKVIYSEAAGAWTPNPEAITEGSLFIANLQIDCYVQYIKRYAKGRMLDCGCGTAPYYGIYKDLVERIECIDWENSPHEISFADKFVNLNERLPYEKDSFDTVLLSDVLEHIAYPDKLMSEISRVLKPGGTLLCFVPFMYWIHEMPHDYHRYTRYALEKLCNDYSFDMVELEPYGGGPDVAIDVINKLSTKSRINGVLAKAAKLYTKTKAYSGLKKRTMNKIPLGYTLAARRK
jgi:ubiquinone/menaquinone biosynthesis C-methylase UbiE